MNRINNTIDQVLHIIGNKHGFESEKVSVQKARFVLSPDRSRTELWKTLKQRIELLGISTIQIDSLGLVPLLETAQDDGSITQNQKNIIAQAMKNMHLLTLGIDPKLRDLWEAFRNRTSFPIVWTVYLRDLGRGMSPDEKAAFKGAVTDLCKFMIRRIGGFIKTPDIEKRILESIESALT
jgi:hypothetical protein